MMRGCCGGNRLDVSTEAHSKPVTQKKTVPEADEAANLRELAQTAFLVGTVLGEEGKLHESLACFKDACDLDCRHVGAHLMLAITYAELNHPQEALNNYRKTIRLQPTHFLAWYNLGTLYLEQHQGDRAVKCFKRATELEPQDLDALVNLGLAQKKMGHMTEACKSFQRAIDIDGRCVMAMFDLANTLMDMRSLDRAISAYLQLLQIDPQHHDSQLNLAICFTERSNSYLRRENGQCAETLKRDQDIQSAIRWYQACGTQEACVAAQQLKLVLRAETAEKLISTAVESSPRRRPLGTLSLNSLHSQPSGKKVGPTTPLPHHDGYPLLLPDCRTIGSDINPDSYHF